MTEEFFRLGQLDDLALVDNGNILAYDRKFVALLYQQNRDRFTDIAKVSDKGALAMSNIHVFVKKAEKVPAKKPPNKAEKRLKKGHNGFFVAKLLRMTKLLLMLSAFALSRQKQRKELHKAPAGA